MITDRSLGATRGVSLLAAAVLSIPPAIALAQSPASSATCPPCPCAAGSASSATPAASSPSPEDDRIERAKALFLQGNELRKAGDCERAAVKFAESRAILPTVANTLNGAWCLEQTGRIDESLELYEELVTVFREKLSEEQRTTIAPAMNALRKLVGSVEVTSNVPGTVVIDGRTRGRLPMLYPLRVMPGPHNVRVRADGYETFDASVKVEAGKSVSLDAPLQPLANGGRLRIAGAADAQGAGVYVDGALVGKVPWEGILPPGPHVYALRKEGLGTAPRAVRVVNGQTAAETAPALAPVFEVQVSTEPITATIAIDGVALGKGRWIGWLPTGEHTIESSEQGYVTERVTLPMTGETARVPVTLRVDERHPIWDARRAEMAARLSNERTGDEMSFLYMTAAGYGAGTGLWIDAQTEPDSLRGWILPPLLLAGVAPAGAYALDSVGKPLKYGVPQSIAEGILIGAEQGAMLAWWLYARSGDRDEPNVQHMASMAWGSATVGAVAGGLLGSTLGATPGRASFVGSTALWGGVAFGLSTGAVSPDDTERDDRTALASAIGVAAGTLGGAIVAGPLSPSPARVRLTDLAALGGGVLMAGGYLAFTDGEFEQRTTLGMGTVGIAAGYAVGWYVTRHMPADRPADRAATKTSIFPQVVPTRGGATLGVAGCF